MIDIAKLSNTYRIQKLSNDNIDDIFSLCKENELFYKHCPPFCTKELIKEDLVALPPKKEMKDKYYIGFYEKDILIGVMDLIDSYPNDETAFVGFFMMKKNYQGKNIGSNIIKEFSNAIKEIGFKYIRLGYVKTNPQAKAFWYKNGFKPTGVIAKQELYDVVIMQKELK